MPKQLRFCLSILCLSALMLFVSCGKAIRPTVTEEPADDSRRTLDPLASSTDREVVPEVYPVYLEPGGDAGDSLIEPQQQSYNVFDSTQSQVNPTEVYRVQIFTTRLYTEAAREMAIANEIFNQPVHLDYEVPYYKLRVGDFSTREEAEGMVPEIKTIGYRGAWVARVVLKVRQAPTFDERDNPILPSEIIDTVYVEPEVPDTTGLEESGESDE
ncbi:MAG: SPOR domain-containing protein [Candidatus Zixiibacteriota bacterium]